MPSRNTSTSPPEDRREPVILDGSNLTVELLTRLANERPPLSLTPDAWDRIQRGRAIVERHLAAGAPIYGATTGIGSQKDVTVAEAQLATFSNRMIIMESTEFPGPAFPEPVVRAALSILINMMARGGTGVRPALVERLLSLYACDRTPLIRRDTSTGAADLTALSQLSLALLGRSLDDSAPLLPTPFNLAPKESVSLIDNNSFALGHGSLVLAEVDRLLRAFDLAAATALEGLRGGIRAHMAGAAGGRYGNGQTRSRANVLAALEGSTLHRPGEARFLQDPMSFRTVTQVNGAAYEALAWAKMHFEAEINSTADNPIVDLDDGELYTSASMASPLQVLAMDSLRQMLAKVAGQSFERGLKLQSPPFTDLPVGLAEDGAADGGIVSINLHYIASARMGTLLAAAAPVMLHYVGHMSDSVEDLSTLTPLSVTQTETVIERCWEIAAVEMAVAVWAINRRRLDISRLGQGPRAVYEQVRPLLPIGQEGERVFDVRPIVAWLRSSTVTTTLGG